MVEVLLSTSIQETSSSEGVTYTNTLSDINLFDRSRVIILRMVRRQKSQKSILNGDKP